MQVRSSHHLTAILQAGSCNQTTWQYTNWDVVQPKHQHVFVQYHWFARRLGEKHAVRIWEWMQVRTISQLYFQAGSYNYNQTTCQYANCFKLRQWNPCGPTQTFTLACPIPLVCKRLEDNHAGGMRVIMEVHTISLLYFKQADTTKQPTAIQTVTMQPMWCNTNINTYLFNSTGLHEGWKKFTQLEYGNECKCAPSHSFIFKQAVTTKQPASMQIVSNCDNATHVVQPKHTH